MLVEQILVAEILDKIECVGAKSPIFYLFSLDACSDSGVTPSEKKVN